MSEELLQKNLVENPEKIGKWDFYNIGATNLESLKKYKKIRDIDYGVLKNKKPDALIIQNKQVIAVIEYKKPSQFKTEEQKQKAIKQEIEVAKKLNAKIFIATDTQESVWVNALTGNLIKDENKKEINFVFNPKDEKIVNLIERINESINEKTDNIKEKKFVNPINLAKSIWQDVWFVSGESPTNSLYTFVEIFIFKYLSDLNVLNEPENFDYLMNLYEKRSRDYVLEYYAKNIRPKIKNLFPYNHIDKTTIINGSVFIDKEGTPNKMYSNVFYKVLHKFKDYGVLENIDHDFKSQLFEVFLKESDSKKKLGQFFTPLKVVKSIVEMAKDDIKAGIKICDPACGVGKFLLEPVKTKLNEFYEIKNGKLVSKITICGFDKGFDGEEQKTIILAKANMLIYFSDLIKENPEQTEKFAELFNESFTLKTNSILGTLSDPVENEYDLILTNPPYVASGSSNLKDEIKKDGNLMNYFKVSGMGIEGLFIEWIIKALKPGGKAFIVVPDGILNRQNDKNLRQLILDECFIDGIISLPHNTFFTTPQKTYILAFTKKINKKDVQIDPVFTYLVSEIGETRDSDRFDIEQNDLQEAVTLYLFFKGNKKGFEKINFDKRCKLQPIEKLIQNFDNTNNAWGIDKWWNNEEKINLRIIEKDKIFDINDIPQLLEELKGNIRNLQNEILKILKNLNNSYPIYKEVPLIELFDIKSGNSKLTKSFVEKNKGDYVVYSANTKEGGVFGYINFFDYDCECIQITTNGVYAGTVFYREKHKFSINGDARILLKKFDDLDYFYLKHVLKKEFDKHGFNWENKPTLGKIKNITLQIPMDSSGKFDIKQQKEIARKHEIIEKMKMSLKQEFSKIQEYKFNF